MYIFDGNNTDRIGGTRIYTKTYFMGIIKI